MSPSRLLSARAIGRRRNAAIRIMSSGIEGVAPPPRTYGTPPLLPGSRAGLALPVMIDEDGARLLPCGVDAARRQHDA